MTEIVLHYFHIILCVWFSSFALQELSAKPLTTGRQLLPTPGDDTFYNPPVGFEVKLPGTILRQRNIYAAIFGLVPDAVDAYQLLYRTTTIDGSATASVTTVFKPINNTTMLDRFVSFQTAYDASAAICDPSYNYRLGVVPSDLIASAEALAVQAYLLSGYIIASPDYEGLEAGFGAGRLEGMAVLDGMRAVTNFKDKLGFSSTRLVILGAGYSGGAIATGWAASLHSKYAPDLNLKGWTSGGTPANLSGTIINLDGSLFSGFVPAILNGLSKPSSYAGSLIPFLNTVLTAYGRTVINFTSENCATADQSHFIEQSIQNTKFQSLGSEFLYHPTMASILQQNIMGLVANETPIVPILLYHALQDEEIPYTDVLDLSDSWCNNGATVNFITFGKGGHLTTEIIGLKYALDFASAAFSNTIVQGCSNGTTVNNTLSPLDLGIEAEPVSVRLIELLFNTSKIYQL